MIQDCENQKKKVSDKLPLIGSKERFLGHSGGGFSPSSAYYIYSVA